VSAGPTYTDETVPCAECGRPIPVAAAGACGYCAVARARAAEAASRRIARELHRRALGLQPLTRSRHRAAWAFAALQEALADVEHYAPPEDAPAAGRALELVHRAAVALTTR